MKQKIALIFAPVFFTKLHLIIIWWYWDVKLQQLITFEANLKQSKLHHQLDELNELDEL